MAPIGRQKIQGKLGGNIITLRIPYPVILLSIALASLLFLKRISDHHPLMLNVFVFAILLLTLLGGLILVASIFCPMGDRVLGAGAALV